jgi:hypothetical protein
MKQIVVFNQKQIRRLWDENRDKWYFSIVDIISVLTDQSDHKKAQSYWTTLKNRLKEEGSQIVTKCDQLKMVASDGKNYLTDAGDTETIFRLIQSIPSPKAEPFKLWLARVGYQRIEETTDPELAINRALNTYLKQGRTPEWVNFRLKSIEVRKDLTDEWLIRGVKTGNEFAILTDDITYAWAGLNTREYKNLKNLKKENLRDNMTNLELILNMLAEVSTKEISKVEKPNTFDENRKVAQKGGSIAGNARKNIESKIKRKVITNKNAKMLRKRMDECLN